MKARKWLALAVAGGVLLQYETCVADLNSYMTDAFVDYFPTLLENWLNIALSTN